MIIRVLVFLICSTYFSQGSRINYIEAVYVEKASDFPVELGHKITFILTPFSGDTYHEYAGFKLFLDQEIVGAFNTLCFHTISVHKTKCILQNNKNGFEFIYKPLIEDNGKQFSIVFIKNDYELWSENGTVVYNATLSLIRQPKYLHMKITLGIRSPYADVAPKNLVLKPPNFLVGSVARVLCETDGALPPKRINLTVTCPPPFAALVEDYRERRYRHGIVSYLPSSTDSLGVMLGHSNAYNLLRQDNFVVGADNRTLLANFRLNASAHNCVVACRLMGKEQQTRLIVYHATSVASFVPTPRSGSMLAGSTTTCIADGHPPPSITLQVKDLFQRSLPSASNWTLAPSEYSIRGPNFSLRAEARPGAEIVLLCAAENALSRIFNSGGGKPVTATVRFTVAAISYSTLSIVIGAGLCLLLFVLVIFAMILLKRRRHKEEPNNGKAHASLCSDRGLNLRVYQKANQYSNKTCNGGANTRAGVVTSTDQSRPGLEVTNALLNFEDDPLAPVLPRRLHSRMSSGTLNQSLSRHTNQPMTYSDVTTLDRHSRQYLFDENFHQIAQTLRKSKHSVIV